MTPESFDAAERLIGDVPQIGSLPVAFTELSKLVDSPSATAEDAARAVCTDPALTAQILRLANSPAYGGVNIQTVPRAVAHLGLRSLRELALASSVVHMFRFMPENVLNMDLFWRHSLATALCAQELGKQLRRPASDGVFVAGLLHDIGTLLLCVQVPRVARRLLMQTQNDQLPAEQVEQSVLGTNHATLGQVLLQRWNLPMEYQIAVGFHHHPTAAPGFQHTTALVHVADVIVEGIALGGSGQLVVPTLDPQVVAKLGLRPHMLAPVIDALEANFEDTVVAMFPKRAAA